jgi:hypothetical protein
MRLQYRAPEGCALPGWYGMAWFDFMTRETVAYPLGLHWLMGWGRILKWHIQFPPWRHHLTSREYVRLQAEGLFRCASCHKRLS